MSFSPTRASVSDARPSRRRSRREPLAEPVSLDSRDMHCLYCPGQHFRRSRLRSKDLRHIILMRYPVRCLRCSQRQFVSFTVAGLAVSAAIKHSRAVSRPAAAWSTWTAAEHEHAQPPASPPPGALHPPQVSPTHDPKDPDAHEVW